MMIKELYGQGRPVLSFEIFPPQKDADAANIYEALGRISALSPDFISVTCGAGGGGNVNRTAEIAAFARKEYGVRSLAHLTCIGAGREGIRRQLDEMKAQGVRAVLALRGDMPNGETPGGDYAHAEDLIRDVRAFGGFCVGAACYPEGHIDCPDLDFDTVCLRRKQEAGADFFIAQLFFDNDYFYRFLDRARGGGVTLPISAGVMPILGRGQIERMIFLCGASLPSGIIKLLHKYENNPGDLRRAGVEYAVKQAEDLLARGADGVHIYTMNKPDVAEFCMKYLRKA